MLMLFVLSCKPWNVVKPGAWLTRVLPRAQQFQDLSLIYGVARLALIAGSQGTNSQGMSSQVRSKVRDLLCFVSEA